MIMQTIVRGNSLTVVDEALRAYEGQTVTLDVLPAVNVKRDVEQTMAALDALCHPGKHVWTEAPAAYIRRMRDDE